LFHQAINSCTVTFEIARVIYCHYDITVLKEKSLAGKPKETTDHHISIALTFQLRSHFNCAHISIARTFQLRSHFNCVHISIARTFQPRSINLPGVKMHRPFGFRSWCRSFIAMFWSKQRVHL
jgi:hypothetical protein